MEGTATRNIAAPPLEVLEEAAPVVTLELGVVVLAPEVRREEGATVEEIPEVEGLLWKLSEEIFRVEAGVDSEFESVVLVSGPRLDVVSESVGTGVSDGPSLVFF